MSSYVQNTVAASTRITHEQDKKAKKILRQLDSNMSEFLNKQILDLVAKYENDSTMKEAIRQRLQAEMDELK